MGAVAKVLFFIYLCVWRYRCWLDRQAAKKIKKKTTCAVHDHDKVAGHEHLSTGKTWGKGAESALLSGEKLVAWWHGTSGMACRFGHLFSSGPCCILVLGSGVEWRGVEGARCPAIHGQTNHHEVACKNGSSVGIRARRVHAFFCTFRAPIRVLGRCSSTKFPASERSRKLIKSALLVGGGALVLYPPFNNKTTLPPPPPPFFFFLIVRPPCSHVWEREGG